MIRLKLIILTVFAMALPQISWGASLHPRFQLRDSNGRPIAKLGEVISAAQTCGECHDAKYIASHSTHGAKGADCFTCHLEAAHSALRKSEAGWEAGERAIAADGFVADSMAPHAPANSNCAQCHFQADDGRAPVISSHPAQHCTEATGQIFSPQRISDSGLNVSGKEAADQPFDVHAERLLNCISCHRSTNNPAGQGISLRSAPAHLRAEPRTLSPGAYLAAPSRTLAMPRCQDCHETKSGHEWLPYQNLHMAALSCEACHIPSVLNAAQQQVDATVLTAEGKAVVNYRGVNGAVNDPASLITGYRPVLLKNAENKLAPHNLIATSYWVAGDSGARISQEQLKRALLDDSGYRAEVLAATDGNGDGAIEVAELRLDTPEKVEAIKRRLEAIGVTNPRISAEVRPFPLSHGVVSGQFAVRQCEQCHSESGTSRIDASFAVARYLPGQVMPAMTGKDGRERLSGTLSVNSAGEVAYQPQPSSGYVIGHDRWSMGDRLGLLAIFATTLGVTFHAGLRLISRKRGSR